MEIFAINGPLFFGVADRFQSTLNAMETPPKVFIMYLHNMSAIDMTGIHALEEFLERRRKGCRVLFAAVRKPVHRTLQRVGIPVSYTHLHIKNLNPVRCADVNIDSYNELGKESKSSYLLPLSSVVFTFSYFREAPVDWKLVLVTNFDDAQLLCLSLIHI